MKKNNFSQKKNQGFLKLLRNKKINIFQIILIFREILMDFFLYVQEAKNNNNNLF